MNNHGQTAIFGIMLGLVIIILALALAPVITETTERAMNASEGDTIGMDCSNASISNFQKSACIATDISPFWVIGVMILIGGGFVVAKILI